MLEIFICTRTLTPSAFLVSSDNWKGSDVKWLGTRDTQQMMTETTTHVP